MDATQEIEVRNEFRYVGSELDLAAAALNWKVYWSEQIAPYLQGDVLEVGAGIGSNTRFLRTRVRGRWVCLEPDASLLARLRNSMKETEGCEGCESICGTLSSLAKNETFDTLVYIDVLEHIEHDAEELKSAASRLRAGGRIVVLAPAYQCLYTHFDAAIGHFRRYNRSSLRRLTPEDLRLEALFNLDTCGIAASAMNRLMLRQALPTEAQLRMWDKFLVPASRVIDAIVMHTLGKSIIAVWRKPLDAD